MGTKLYVGNLSFNTTETDLQDLFAQAGPVQEVTLMQDKFTGKSRGFAFVTMTSDADAQKAITEFNGKTVEGRPLTVNEARPREARPPGGGGGYGGGGGGAAVVAVATAAAVAATAAAVVATAAVVAAVDVATAADAAAVAVGKSNFFKKRSTKSRALFCCPDAGIQSRLKAP